MLMVVENLGNAGSEFQLEFDNLLLIVHYYTFRAAMKGLTGLDDQIAKISTCLLRYTEIIPADKAFYEAGLACRAAKKPEMAMIFMNRFLDLVEAIENDDGMLDPEGFEETEIPVEVPLPDKVCLPQGDVEEIRNWVLNMSIDQRNLNHQLPMDKRGTFEGNLKGGRPCIVTGYPILGQTVQFRRGRAANNTDWRALIHQVSRMHSGKILKDSWGLQFFILGSSRTKSTNSRNFAIHSKMGWRANFKLIFIFCIQFYFLYKYHILFISQLFLWQNQSFSCG